MKTELLETISTLPFSVLDYLVISINLIIFLMAGFIVKGRTGANQQQSVTNRVKGLRTINLVLFLIYAFVALVEIVFAYRISHLQEISQTGLTILVSYIIIHFIQEWIVLRFGKEKLVDGDKVRGESYASEIVGLTALILTSCISFLLIINIWSLNSWLQATSVIGGILLLIFASRDYFLNDMISGLIMHYNNSVEAGSVIRVKEFDLLGVVLQITLSQTVVRDLIQKHEITIPNSKLRGATIETLSNCGQKGFRDFLDFKIGYDVDADKVRAFFDAVWQNAIVEEAALNPEAKPSVVVIDNSDHAVIWRVLYYVKNTYRISEARNTIQTAARELSMKNNVALNTPVTHQILERVD